MLNKDMLIGVLKNDLKFLNTSLDDSIKVAKLIGKSEMVAQIINAIESGNFNYIPKEVEQEKTVAEIDTLVIDVNSVEKQKES